jgi:hypothetical protein
MVAHVDINIVEQYNGKLSKIITRDLRLVASQLY